jgi:hypothetical protein
LPAFKKIRVSYLEKGGWVASYVGSAPAWYGSSLGFESRHPSKTTKGRHKQWMAIKKYPEKYAYWKMYMCKKVCLYKIIAVRYVTI